MPTVLITGGTGLVGTYLTRVLLEKRYHVIILSRTIRVSDHPNLFYAKWNVYSGEIDAEAIKKADHIIHLAGAGVADKRWTKKRKKEIIESRTRSSNLIIKALKEILNNVQTVVSASAIGWYGPDTKESKLKGFTEEAPADSHFLGETCRLWESSIDPVTALGKRLIKFRIGIVLAEEGGALKEFSKPVKFGIATIMGSGEQIVSWIHVNDLCRMLIYTIENPTLAGIYNAVAPNPVTNKELMLTLAEKLRGKVFLPLHVPAFALKLALGEMSVEILKSATVNVEKIKKTGFTFFYPTLRAALHLK